MWDELRTLPTVLIRGACVRGRFRCNPTVRWSAAPAAAPAHAPRPHSAPAPGHSWDNVSVWTQAGELNTGRVSRVSSSCSGVGGRARGAVTVLKRDWVQLWPVTAVVVHLLTLTRPLLFPDNKPVGTVRRPVAVGRLRHLEPSPAQSRAHGPRSTC